MAVDFHATGPATEKALFPILSLYVEHQTRQMLKTAARHGLEGLKPGLEPWRCILCDSRQKTFTAA